MRDGAHDVQDTPWDTSWLLAPIDMDIRLWWGVGTHARLLVGHGELVGVR